MKIANGQVGMIGAAMIASLTCCDVVAEDQVVAHVPEAVMRAADNNGYFVSLDLGLAAIDWRDVHANISSSGQYGFSYGLNGGYRWGPHFGVEGGYYELPSVKYSGGNTSGSLGYGAFEMMTPLWKSWSVFVDVGLGHRVFDDSVSGLDEATSPILLTGIECGVLSTWSVGIKYVYFNAHESFAGTSVSSPSVNLVLAGLSHTF